MKNLTNRVLMPLALFILLSYAAIFQTYQFGRSKRDSYAA
jgi:hypothetical protein